MSNIITFDGFDDANIRVTPDGRYSVFDVIKFCGCKSQRQVWKRVVEQYAEVVTKCDNFKFEGKGQRETPVAYRENIVYIIGLLPGAVGRSYREQAAKVFLAYLDASPELAGDIIDRASPEDLKKIQARLKGKQIRVEFTSVLQNHGVTQGWQFGNCTNTLYRNMLGGTVKELKAERNLPAKANLRDELDLKETVEVMFAEHLSSLNIEKKNRQGYTECNQEIDSTTKAIRDLLDA